MVCTPDILLKNDCTNFNLKKRTAPEKKGFFNNISYITINNSWNYTKNCFRVITQQNQYWTQLEQRFSPTCFFLPNFSQYLKKSTKWKQVKTREYFLEKMVQFFVKIIKSVINGVDPLNPGTYTNL